MTSNITTMMKRINFIVLICLIIPFFALAGNNRIVKANSEEVGYVGRTQTLTDGSVRYDWVGVYLQTQFSGSSVAVRISETGKSFHNVFIDGKWIRKIKFTGKDTLITLASDLSKSFHQLKLQKCTEGEYGCTTIHQLLLASGGQLKAVPDKLRRIEIYGDSYTCGYGSESNSPNDHFKVETENCNKAYGCIIARYFDADYILTAHSGRGVVRNYGDSKQSSRNTIVTRMTHLYDDFDPSIPYDRKDHKPNLVLINLGTNDFSTQPIPTDENFIAGYIRMIHQLRTEYKEIPILCVIPHSGGLTGQCLVKLKKEMSSDKNLYLSNPMENIVGRKSDMGADAHPNYSGHQKIAMTLIPQISTIMNWKLEKEVVE